MALGLNPALVVFDSNGATVNAPMTGTSTAGSSHIFEVTWTPLNATPQTPVTITSAGLTITADVTKEQAGGTYAIQSYIFRVHNVPSATDRAYVLNLPTTGGYGTIKATEFTDLNNAAPEATNSGGAATATNPSLATGSVTQVSTNGLVIAVAGLDSGANPSITGHPPAGMISLGLEADQTAHMSGAHAYRITNSAGAYSATWGSDSTGGAGTWSAAIAVYGATGGGGGGVVRRFDPIHSLSTVGNAIGIR